ncbi:hypothetical protein F4861DRAFT_542494 [Xylaria intraflava]|nr:hypothetical protein F4861DRAFT_542494 [Xylaria intraflava]
MPQRIRKIFAKVTLGSRQKDAAPVAAESSHLSAQKPVNRPPLEVLYPSPDLSASNEIEVDIIAVHGLGANVDWSWTWQDKKGSRPPVNWLREPDMLPSVVPRARIIAYNYESRWHAGAPRTRLELCGEELANSLHDFRSDDPKRPLVFVAHSLGGLVVLHGLLYADRTEKLKYLPESTVGFAPLGTPFRGTKMQSLAKTVAWFLTPMGSHDGIITDLEQDGKHLADEVHAFGQLRNRLDIPTTCFIELYESDYGKKIGITGLARGMVVEEESAHIPGWGRAQLNTDHFKLNKFSGPDDRSFQTVSNEIRNMCAQGKSVIEKRKQITPERHFMVPFGRNDGFVGRDAILEQLLEKIPPSANKDDCQRNAIEGLGGIGKTQVVLEAAYRVREEHPDCSVFWVPAVDLTSFDNAYREIGHLLELPGVNDGTTDIKAIVKDGLEDKEAGSWLLIIDNADDTDMLFTSANLAEYLPFSRQGSILFTTRNHEVTVRLDISQANHILMPKMDDAEATRLLQMSLKESQLGDAESMKRLLGFLTNLPLAIKQASAYMALNTSVTVSDYLDFCESSNADQIDLLSRQFEDRHRYKYHATSQNPVATTWLISFEYISQHNAQAADYLKFMCFLAEKDIPLSLLPVVPKIKMAEAIGMLKAYAFIMERDTPDSFDIHRLVRLVMRNWLQEKGEWEAWTKTVVQQFEKEYPRPEHKDRKRWTRYLPHGQAVLETTGAVAIVDYDFPFLIGESYLRLGRYGEAERLFRQLLEISERMLGREHDKTLTCMNNLAHILDDQGNYEEAEKMYRYELGLAEKVLGEEHAKTLVSKNNLAQCLHEQGKYSEAEKIHRKVLELREAKLGRENSNTLLSMNNLALVLLSQGKYGGAEEMLRPTLELMEKMLGKDHPMTLTSMNNLTVVFDNQGKYEEAEKMGRQALRLREEILGREHPHTLSSMNNLATALQRQGKFEEAEKLYREVLELNGVSRSNHPGQLTSMNNLAYVLESQGKYEESEALYRKVIGLREEILGKDHPDTLVSMSNLASISGRQGKYEEQEALYRETLRLREEVLGKEHPDTLTSMSNLASVCGRHGKYEEEEELYRNTLRLREEVLGKDHPDTLISMSSLTVCLQRQGKCKEAEELPVDT